jgi:hypothetical protein
MSLAAFGPEDVERPDNLPAWLTLFCVLISYHVSWPWVDPKLRQQARVQAVWS